MTALNPENSLQHPPLVGDDPFVVRAHHAQQLYMMLGIGLNPDEVTNEVERISSNTMDKKYYRDVYGAEPEQSASVKRSHSRFFNDFLTLPDDATVRFVAGQKDAICDTCVIGKHCEATSPIGDAGFLKTIGRLAQEQGMEDVLVESEIIIAGWKKPSPVLELPAWAARKILSDIDFHAQNRPRFTRPLARLLVRKAVARHQKEVR